MKSKKRFKEDQELDLLQQQQLELVARQKASSEARERIERERIEREITVPPFDEIQARKERKRHELYVTRGEISNELRTQNRSLMLLFLLAAATCALVWWGFSLMQGP